MIPTHGVRLTRLRERLRRPTTRYFEYDSHRIYGLTYQSCRFCGVDALKTGGLWKYGVRHYICDECRTKADPTLAARKERD